jgi:diguanylate cyclase (GGDEF)-like protein
VAMDRLDSFLDHAPALIAIFNRHLKLVKANPAFVEICQITGVDYVGKSLSEVAPSPSPTIQALLEEVLFVDKPIHREIITQSSAYADTMRHWHAMVFPAGEFEVGFVGIEVTEQKRIEEALQGLNRRLESTLAENERTAVMNEMAHVLQAARVTNEIYSIVGSYGPRLFPGSVGTLGILNSAKNALEIVAAWGGDPVDEAIFPPDDCWALREGRSHVVNDPQSGLICSHVNRGTESAELCVPMLAQYEALGILHLSKPLNPSQPEPFTSPELHLAEAVAQEIALPLANVRLRQLLQEQALRDGLTGLYNRRYFEEALDREVHRATRKQTSLGLIMLDVDHFKELNDAHGHTAGDALLRAVADLLHSCLRAADVLCRYGGDEFAIVMPDAVLQDTVKKAEEMRRAAKSLSLQLNGRVIDGMSISLGAAAFPHHGSTREILIQQADSALYAAKTGGRDQVKTNPMPLDNRDAASA